MTGQIPDTCIYRRHCYDLVGIAGTGLPEPEQFGLRPVPTSTACWRGYVAHYAIRRRRLLLDAMDLSAEQYLPINQRLPERGEYGGMTYRQLDLPIAFGGRLVLATDFIRERYIHMGFQAASAYRTVIELSFDTGALTAMQDWSEHMEHWRAAEDAGRAPAEDIIGWIERRFARDLPAGTPAAPPDPTEKPAGD